MARWLVHKAGWATASSVATTSNSGTRIPGFPFGKVVTVSDGWGNTTESTGKPILLMMEAQSFAQDMMNNSGRVSLTFSEKEVTSGEGGTCVKGAKIAQFPMCSHLTVQGVLREMQDPEEVQHAKEAIIARHPDQESWFHGPHDFKPWRMEDIRAIYLIDHFGGAPTISVKDYLNAKPSAPQAGPVVQ
eukprot:CAMPEP_0196759108 /NCGR_PEP_ID=MMETSP1091-20130531/104517_1 /TAXON_ID=302021 /ORGANISM="Rhodomonas sp., Strain CCMP768" /LENGTH=187 /DNA_ID=CAMNT_0042107951 /DNA_START=132 /DNA_END=695 /DNA_ORIENTATION=-